MKKTLLILTIILSFIGSGFIMFNSNNVETKYSYNDTTLNESNVYITLLRLNIKYPEVVMSQIMIESSHLTSRLCRKNNNLLGMTVPGKRQTTAINEEGYAKYKSWMDCVLDYKFYQDYIMSRHKLNTKSKYIAFLHKNYANSANYKSSLISMSKSYELRNPFNFINYGI
jgi:uncharacterized FlgJ-related protein